MNWSNLNLHIENLIPGIVVLAEAIELLQPTTSSFPIGDVGRSVVFVACAYALGLACSVTSRCVVDLLSELAPRGWAMHHFGHVELPKLVRHCGRREPSKFRDELIKEKESCRYGKYTPFWNVCYRATLRRASANEEVLRRRSQGRLVRNLWFPFVGFILILMRRLFPELPMLTALLGSLFVGLIGTVLLYAYAEYMNFAEAHDMHVQASNRSTDANKTDAGDGK